MVVLLSSFSAIFFIFSFPPSQNPRTWSRNTQYERGRPLHAHDTVELVSSTTNNSLERNTSDKTWPQYVPLIGKDEDAEDEDYNYDNLTVRALISSPFKKTAYQVAQARGCKLRGYLAEPSSAPPTPWTNYQDLLKWGWMRSEANTNKAIYKAIGNLQAPLAAEGVSITTPPCQNVMWDHGWITEHDGKQYPPTLGNYKNIYVPSQGAIIAYSSFGPRFMKNKPNSIFPQDAPLPLLQSWSDVVFLTWVSITTAAERQSLRLIVRQQVINQETRAIVSKALEKDKVNKFGVPPRWPGYTFSPTARDGKGAKAFQAVLGTPNVYGVAWLLIQHVQDLGAKTITAITVWDPSDFANQNAGWNLAIMVRIGDS